MTLLKSFTLNDKTYWHGDNAKFILELGKGKASYHKRWTFDSPGVAVRQFNCLCTHSGYKKRLVMLDENKRTLLVRSLS